MPELLRPLRMAVIGLGVGREHMAAYATLPDTTLTAIVGLEAPALQDLGVRYEVPYRFTRWEDLLDLDDIDAVSVASPAFLHEPMTVALLDRGLHVLCEKPMARTGPEADLMVAAARRNERVLQVAFNHRQRADVAEMKRLIDLGLLGDIYYAKAYWLRRKGIPPSAWFTQVAASGGGALADIGVHMLDAALHLLGNPQVRTVSASTWNRIGTASSVQSAQAARAAATGPITQPVFDVEDLATLFLRLDGDVTLQVESSWAMHRSKRDEFGIRLYGTEGGAELRVIGHQHGILRTFTERDGEFEDSRYELAAGHGHLAVARRFVDAIRTDAWATSDGSRAALLSHLIDAAYRSATQRAETTIPPAAPVH